MIAPSSCMIVVGEKFEDFSRHQKNTWTIGALVARLNDENAELPREILIGQGVELWRIMPSLSAGRASDKRKRPVIVNYEQIADQSNTLHHSSVHKRHAGNVLITAPATLGGHAYRMLLSIQDSCELLADHMTGQHIQGVVLVEAARQAMLSISENYLLQPEQRGRCYFVLSSIDTDFRRFGFPITTTINALLLDHGVKSNGFLKGQIEFNFQQAGECIAIIRIGFAAYDATFISTKENDLARDACQFMFVERSETDQAMRLSIDLAQLSTSAALRHAVSHPTVP